MGGLDYAEADEKKCQGEDDFEHAGAGTWCRIRGVFLLILIDDSQMFK